MAKYTATIDEGTRQKTQALLGRVNFSAFMRKAITIFVEELKKNPVLGPRISSSRTLPGKNRRIKK